MSIENRPYVGTWALNNKQVIRHTPDALVYVNGDVALPGCPNCNGKINIQQFVTQVSVDPATAPPASASITLHIPRQHGQSVLRDGQYLFRPGLEVNIYMRGYFPQQGALGESDAEPEIDPSRAVFYPYYHVFHGVVIEVSAEQGNEHTYTLSCADLLHFWQFHRLTTSGSVFGARPSNSKNQTSLIGNNFNGMTPYSIIYSMWRDVAGAAGGVEFALSDESNVDANSTSLDRSLFSLTMLYWEKRFNERMFNLRMYGTDGTLYNSFQQAFLSKLSTDDAQRLAEIRFADKTVQDKKQSDPFQRLARLVGYDPVSQWVATESEPGEDGEQNIGLSLTQMQAFVQDMGDFGSVNFFESQYETKLDISNTVTALTGFEFYQDVDGDLVFKPPFYNLDTSSSRVYVIKPIDIISFSTSEKEPEATVIKGSATFARNMTGMVSGPFGAKRGMYIDYRLVAQFGWREQSFESEYYSDPRAMFFAAVNRLDLFNIAVNSASCQIPLRPELRPGYPVYIEHLDCFYYLDSFNHSFQYGAQCTTTLNLTGKRAKFLPPGVPPLDRATTIDDIKLDNPWLPRLPLTVEGFDGIPRIQGFPNVVMGLDPELMNPSYFVTGSLNLKAVSDDPDAQLDQLILRARTGSNPVITLAAGDSDITDDRERLLSGPYVILKGNGQSTQITRDELRTQLTNLTAARTQMAEIESDIIRGADVSLSQQQQAEDALAEAEEASTELSILIEAAQSSLRDNFPEAESTAAYLDLLDDRKANFTGGGVPGYYRYFSASHPDPVMQGQREVVATDVEGTFAAGVVALEEPTTVLGFRSSGDGVEFGEVEVTSGLPIMQPGTAKAVPTPTHIIQQISFAKHEVTTTRQQIGQSVVTQLNFSPSTYVEAMRVGFENDLLLQQYDETSLISDLFQDRYETYSETIQEVSRTSTYGVTVPSFGQATEQAGFEAGGALGTNPQDNVALLADSYARILARAASHSHTNWHKELTLAYGSWGQAPLGGATAEAKERAFCELESAWERLRGQLDPEGRVAIKTTSGWSVKRSTANERTKPFYSPVFPVSDQRGYEVVGTYRYGRGLEIEPGGNFEQLSDADALAEDLGLDTVEEIVAALLSETDLSKAVGTLDAETQAKLAEELGLEAEAGDGLPELLKNADGKSMFERAFTARAANTNQYTQKVNVTNAAYGLADLDITNRNDICSCKGAESDILLLAFNTDNFTDLGLEDDVSNYVSSKMVDLSFPWAASQDALRGETVDRNSTGLFEAGSSIANNIGNLLPTAEAEGVVTAGEEAAEAGQQLADASTQLAEDIQNFTDGLDEG